jgi:hypothetical protein
MQTGLHQQKKGEINASPEQMPNNIVPAKERKFIVFESKLNELFQKECSVCGEKGKMTKQHIIGTAISVVINCNCNQPFKWSSQPFSGTMQFDNFRCSDVCWMQHI